MKFLNLIFISILAVILLSCKSQIIDPGDMEIADFEIHFQYDFNDDDVLLKFDNSNIYAGTLNTDYTISLAKSFQLQAYSGQHVIYVNLNNSQYIRKEFTLTDGLFILIRYYDEEQTNSIITSGLEIEITNIRPLYD